MPFAMAVSMFHEVKELLFFVAQGGIEPPLILDFSKHPLLNVRGVGMFLFPNRVAHGPAFCAF